MKPKMKPRVTREEWLRLQKRRDAHSLKKFQVVIQCDGEVLDPYSIFAKSKTDTKYQVQYQVPYIHRDVQIVSLERVA